MGFRKNNLVLAIALLFSSGCFTQSIQIGAVDLFGNRKIGSDVIRSYIGVKEGDTVSRASLQADSIAKELERIPGVKHATVNPICCDTAHRLLLYVGIGESDSVLLKHPAAPEKNLQLPDTLLAAYRDFGQQVEVAVRNGQSTEDYSQGYSLINYLPAQYEQRKFIDFAKHDFALLEAVLKSSRFAEQRAAAAEIIAYSTNRKKVVGDLIYAVTDEDETVRNNATRAIAVSASYLIAHPELNISVPATPFIKMMNSIVWTDRNKGAFVLAQLTQNRDPKLLQQIKAHALPSIIEMARWKDRGHAAYSFLILGRLSGAEEATLLSKNYSKQWPEYVDEMVKKAVANL